jgi:uncharacterized protein YwgA
MRRQDWLLLVTSAAGERGLTPVQLQKTLFLLGRNFTRQVGSDFYEFAPYNYGPFCVEIYRDAETLQAKGLVDIRHEGRRWPEYHLTPAGQRRAAQLKKKLAKDLADYIQELVRWTQSLSFPTLVRSIYQSYPEFSENSVFQG